MFDRSRTDETYLLSPETLLYAPQSLRDRILSIRGVDGVYLKPRPNFYLHNFLAFRKRNVASVVADDSVTSDFGSPRKKNKKSNIVKLKDLEFLGLLRELTANELVLEGSSAITSSAYASHQTWIADGSLFCSDNYLPSDAFNSTEEGSDFLKAVRSVRKQYCANWQYIVENVSQSVNQYGNEQSKSQTSFIHIPSVKGISAIEDPVDAIEKNNLTGYFMVAPGSSSKVYRDINPGLHWRVLKRTPLFQGEDFVVEINQTAIQSSNINSSDSKFRMQEKFDYLDINTMVNETQANCGSLNNEGFVDKDKNGKIIEETKKIFDFSRQVYFMLEIGVDDPDHHYVLIIAANSFPMFCHIGKTPTLKCSLEATETPSVPKTSSSSSESQSCVNEESSNNQSKISDSKGEDDQRLSEVSIIEIPKKEYLRRLGTYDIVNSLTLLQQKKLKISVRQHGPNIVVVFSGYENHPWVISRKDIDPNSSASPGTPVTESQISYKPMRMIIPASQIALMGGNIKCGFSFAPHIYEAVRDYRIPNTFSLQGPVKTEDVHFLWRDKGVTKNPQVSAIDSEIQYTNEAGAYTEITFSPEDKGTSERNKTKSVTTKAIDVQPEFVKKYGKAPDLEITQEAKNYGIDYSYLKISASKCLSRSGSDAETSILMQATITMEPGGYMFPEIDGGKDWPLHNCVTPVAQFFRMYVPASGFIFNKNPIDVSQHVMTFSDEWSETDWNKLEHSGRISFLISDGMKFRNNQANAISSLIDKAFYLQISMWWEGGIMPTPVQELDKVVFTGFCLGGTIVTETNKKILDCQIFDYSKIMKDQFFLNSPFFDRMRDVNAIREILQISGMRDGEDTGSTLEPGSMVRVLADSNPQDEWYSFFFNGEKIITREFALPGAYDILQSPFMRFNDGQPLWEAVDRIAALSNKVAYFDRLGVFCFHALPYDQALFGGQQGNQPNWTINDWAKLSKADFFVSPKGISNPPSLNNQVIGEYKIERLVSDVVNEIKVISTSVNGEILIAGHVNYDSLRNPDVPGFLGYHKTFLQMDGIFGSEANIKWIVKNYTKMFIPPIKVSFKAIGRNKIKALDVITFRPLGSREKQPLIVSSVRSEVDASSNTWYQDFECLWLFPSQDIQWGTSGETAIDISGTTVSG
jgi:hypothetical protein